MIIEQRFKESLPVKRLRILQNAVEIIAVNGRPFNYLLDSGYQAGIQNKLQKLKNSGMGLNFSKNLPEIKEHLTKMAENVRIKIISLMADIGTKNNRSMFGVSAQFVVFGKVHIRSLGLFELDQSHTGVYLANVLRDCLSMYGIEKWQTFCITTDNGKNILKMVRDFNDLESWNVSNINENANISTPHNVLLSNDNDCAHTDDEIQHILAQCNEITDEDALDMIFL